MRMTSLTGGVALAVIAGWLPAGAEAQAPTVALPDSVSITEWTVPWERSRPRDPDVDAQGRVWFVGQAGNYIAHLDPTSGQFRQYEIDPGTHPHNLVVGPDGMIWYTGNRNAMIGRLNPATGAITRFPMPNAEVRDPHTMVFDRKGRAFFTAQQAGYVGRLDPASGQVTLLKLETPNARPYGIEIDSKGQVWFNEFGTNKIGRLNPETMELREYTLPDPKTRDRRIAITSDDMIWYGDYTRGYLGRLDPATGQVQEWALPGGAMSLPYAVTVDNKDRLWLVETGLQPNRLVGFNTRTRRFFNVTPILPSGGGTVRHMIFHAPSHSIWFGTDANTIGRARLPGEPST